MVKRHEEIAERIVTHDEFKGKAIIAVTHNNGSQGSTWGCTLRTSSKIPEAALSEFETPRTLGEGPPGSVFPYSIVLKRLITVFMMRQNDLTPRQATDIAGRGVWFPKRIKLGDILDMVRA
jgi:hypothetical protein